MSKVNCVNNSSHIEVNQPWWDIECANAKYKTNTSLRTFRFKDENRDYRKYLDARNKLKYTSQIKKQTFKTNFSHK